MPNKDKKLWIDCIAGSQNPGKQKSARCKNRTHSWLLHRCYTFLVFCPVRYRGISFNRGSGNHMAAYSDRTRQAGAVHKRRYQAYFQHVCPGSSVCTHTVFLVSAFFTSSFINTSKLGHKSPDLFTPFLDPLWQIPADNRHFSLLKVRCNLLRNEQDFCVFH